MLGSVRRVGVTRARQRLNRVPSLMGEQPTLLTYGRLLDCECDRARRRLSSSTFFDG